MYISDCSCSLCREDWPCSVLQTLAWPGAGADPVLVLLFIAQTGSVGPRPRDIYLQYICISLYSPEASLYLIQNSVDSFLMDCAVLAWKDFFSLCQTVWDLEVFRWYSYYHITSNKLGAMTGDCDYWAWSSHLSETNWSSGLINMFPLSLSLVLTSQSVEC